MMPVNYVTPKSEFIRAQNVWTFFLNLLPM